MRTAGGRGPGGAAPTRPTRSVWVLGAESAVRIDLPQEPVHAGEMLLVVAAQEVDERLQRDLAVTLEHRRARQFTVADVADLLDGRVAPLAKRGQHLRWIGLAVAALLGERVSVERGEQRPGFLTRGADADLVAVRPHVSPVAGLFEGGEHLVRHALPALRLPVRVARGDQAVEVLELRRHRCERGDGLG